MRNLLRQSICESESTPSHWTAECETVHCTARCILPMLKCNKNSQLIILNSVSFWSSQSLLEQSKCTYLYNMYIITDTFRAQISINYTATTYAQLLNSFFRSFTEQRVAVDSDSAVPEILIWTTCNQYTCTCASTVALDDFTEHISNTAEQ